MYLILSIMDPFFSVNWRVWQKSFTLGHFGIELTAQTADELVGCCVGLYSRTSHIRCLFSIALLHIEFELHVYDVTHPYHDIA